MVVVQFALIPERVAQKTVPKLFQTKDGTKFTNIIGVSLRTINIFGSCWNNIVETITPVRPRKKTTGKKKRFTRIYHLENEKGQKVSVCQKMFLSTINLTTDKTIGTLLPGSGGSRTNDVSDKRTKAEPANKKNSVKLQT